MAEIVTADYLGSRQNILRIPFKFLERSFCPSRCEICGFLAFTPHPTRFSDDYDGIRSKTSKPIAAILYTMHALCWLNLFFCLCRGRVSTFCLRSILHCGRLSRSNLSSWLCCASLAIESDPAADTFRVCGRGFRRCLQVHRVRGVIN